ncbi:MAG: PAS-domain containing protein [Holosporales bacterium]|nr:PAS-domain containing protein [Holosporales bacterium]
MMSFLVIAILLTLVFIFSFLLFTRLPIKIKDIGKKAYVYSDVLESLKKSEKPWCVISDLTKNENIKIFLSKNNQNIVYSQGFYKIIEKYLESDDLTFESIANVLESENSSFNKGLQHIMHFEGSFSYCVTLNEKNYLVEGSCVSLPNIEPRKKVQQQNSEEKISIILTISEYSNYINLEKRLLEEKKLTKFFHFLLDNISIPIWTRDHQSKISFCNKAYASLFETSPTNVISKQWEIIAKNKENQDELTNIDEITLKNKGTFKIEEKVLENKWKEDFCIAGVALNVSKYKDTVTKVEQMLKDSYNILNRLNIPFVAISSDGTIQMWNNDFLQFFNIKNDFLCEKVSYEDILDNLVENHELPEYIDIGDIKKKFKDWLKNPNPNQVDMYHKPDGSILSIKAIKYDSKGKILIIFKDITQEINLEGKYKSLVSAYNEIILNSHEAILIIGIDHRIKQCSESIKTILNVEPKKIIGITIKDWLTTFSTEGQSKNWKEALIVAIELRNKKIEYIQISENETMLCEYLPLPNGWHMLTFSKNINKNIGDVNLFDDMKKVAFV